MSQHDWNEITKAIDIIESLYQKHVSELVQQVMDEVKKSDSVNSAADLERYIDDTVQGDEWGQLSRKIRVVLFASENREVVDSTSRATDSQKATAALLVDVREGVDEAFHELGGSMDNPWKCSKCIMRYTRRDSAAECCAAEEEAE